MSSEQVRRRRTCGFVDLCGIIKATSDGDKKPKLSRLPDGDKKPELPRLPDGQHIRLLHLSVHEKVPVSTWQPPPENCYVKHIPGNDRIELFITNYHGEDEELGKHVLTIKLEIACYPLDTLPDYHALSYRWGPVVHKPLAGTHISGGLLECLPFLALDLPGYWWVDAICIDQDNEEEKIEQIKVMGQTFAKAQGAVAYIGPHEDSSLKAIKLAYDTYDRFVTKDLIFQGWQSVIPEPRDVTLRKLGLPGMHDSAWLDIYRLRLRPYFTRVWMIQEVLLAQSVKILCGTTMFPWDILEMISDWMAGTGLITSMAGLAVAMKIPKTGMPLVEVVSTLRHGEKRLADILNWSRGLAATEPKDKIIGVMGLVEQSDPIKQSIEGFYKLPTPEFYAQVTKAIINQDKDLEALEWVDSELRSLPGLPNWVPEYSFTRPATMSDGKMSAMCGAAGRLAFEVDPCDTWDELTLQIKIVDEVIEVTESTNEIRDANQFALYCFLTMSVYADIPVQYFLPMIIGPGNWQSSDDVLLEYRRLASPKSKTLDSKRDIKIDEHVIKNVPCTASDTPDIARLRRGHRLYDQLWRSLIKDGLRKPNLSPKDDRFHFVDFIMSTMAQDVPELINDCAMLVPRDWNLLRDDPLSVLEAVRLNLKADLHIFAVQHAWVLANRLFFITKSGRLGFGPLSTQKGSVIAIARGADACLVLDGSASSKLQGMAFVHGLMNGEGVQMDIPWEKLVLR